MREGASNRDKRNMSKARQDFKIKQQRQDVTAQTTVVHWQIRSGRERKQKTLQSGMIPLDVAVSSVKSPNNKHLIINLKF